MLQQTTVTAVKPFYLRFLDRFPTVAALAEAPVDAVMQAWAGLGYYSRARNLHACAKAVMERHRRRISAARGELLTLPGIGAYTAAAVASIAFNEPAAAVDGNVERVVSRLFTVEEPLPKAKPLIRALTLDLVPPRPAGRFRPGADGSRRHDLHAETARLRALSVDGPMRGARRTARRSSTRKSRRKSPATCAGARLSWCCAPMTASCCGPAPANGLLGGMVETPTSAWEPDYEPSRAMLDAPIEARWQRLPGIVRHVFTHFPLELTVFLAKVPKGTPAAGRHALDAAARSPRGGAAGRDEEGAGACARGHARVILGRSESARTAKDQPREREFEAAPSLRRDAQVGRSADQRPGLCPAIRDRFV